MAKGGAIAAAAAKMGTESKPKKKRIRVVSKDVTQDTKT
jgi:hypothetical protein